MSKEFILKGQLSFDFYITEGEKRMYLNSVGKK